VIARYTKFIIVGALAVSFAVLLQEYAVRLALPHLDPTTQLKFERESDEAPALGRAHSVQRLTKNTGDYDVEVRFNQYGLRDKNDIAQGRPEDLFVVGDSFAFGWGVEEKERFSTILQDLLGRRVYNLASPANIPGYEKMLKFAELQGAEVQQVLLAFNMSDDFVPILKPQPEQKSDVSNEIRFKTLLASVKSFLTSHSSLYFLTTSVVQGVPWMRELGIKVGLIIPTSVVRNVVPSEQSIAKTVERLALLKEKYAVTLAIIPDRGNWIGQQVAERRNAHDRFLKKLSEYDLPYIDLRKEFEHRNNPTSLLFKNDAHWQSEGHRLAAKVIAEKFRAAR